MTVPAHPSFSSASGAGAPILWDTDNSQRLCGVSQGIGLTGSDGDSLSGAQYIGDETTPTLKFEASSPGAVTAFTMTPAAGALTGKTTGQALSVNCDPVGTYYTPVVFELADGDLPTGAALNASTGVISHASLTTVEECEFTIRCTDADGNIVENAYTLSVTAP